MASGKCIAQIRARPPGSVWRPLDGYALMASPSFSPAGRPNVTSQQQTPSVQAPVSCPRTGGSILDLTSRLALIGVPTLGASAATKGALQGLTGQTGETEAGLSGELSTETNQARCQR
jgi:hypothetical protein